MGRAVNRTATLLSALLPTILLSSCDGGSTKPVVIEVMVT